MAWSYNISNRLYHRGFVLVAMSRQAQLNCSETLMGSHSMGGDGEPNVLTVFELERYC